MKRIRSDLHDRFVPPPVGPDHTLHLPAELHTAWMDYLSQRELLCVAAVSKRWRAIATRHPEFYMSVRLQSIRMEQESFVKKLTYCSRHGLRMSVRFHFPYCLREGGFRTLEKVISPVLRKTMSLVREIHIITVAMLPTSCLGFILEPAPVLRAFVYYVCKDVEMHVGGYCPDASATDTSSDGPAPTSRRTKKLQKPLLVPGLFGRTAPLLRYIELPSLYFPPKMIPALTGARHVKLQFDTALALPATPFVAQFPAAESMSISILGALPPEELALAAYQRIVLPRSLHSLEVGDPHNSLLPLLDQNHLYAISHLVLQFDGRGLIQWAPFLANLSASSLQISSEEDKRGGPFVWRATVSTADKPGRSLTFYGVLPCRGIYEQPAQLSVIHNQLTDVKIELIYISLLFDISTHFPSLHRLAIIVDMERKRFWRDQNAQNAKDRPYSCTLDDAKRAHPPEQAIVCPVLEEVSLHAIEECVIVCTHELAHFGHALGLLARDSQSKPRLILAGVHLTDGEHHLKAFSAVSTEPAPAVLCDHEESDTESLYSLAYRDC